MKERKYAALVSNTARSTTTSVALVLAEFHRNFLRICARRYFDSADYQLNSLNKPPGESAEASQPPAAQSQPLQQPPPSEDAERPPPIR